jgi:hypothetical protein
MSEVQERIAHLVESGRVSPAEGQQLLGAVQPPRRSLGWRLIDPFESLDARLGLAIAAGVLLAQLAVSRLGVRFDGALDMHLTHEVPSIGVALLDAVVSVPFFCAVLWASARLAAKGARFVDFLWAVGSARLPVVLGAIANRLVVDDPRALARSVVDGQPAPVLLWVILIALPMLGWTLLWLYFAHRTASGTRGVRSGVSFVAGVVVAEIASKAILVAVLGTGAR